MTSQAAVMQQRAIVRAVTEFKAKVLLKIEAQHKEFPLNVLNLGDREHAEKEGVHMGLEIAEEIIRSTT